MKKIVPSHIAKHLKEKVPALKKKGSELRDSYLTEIFRRKKIIQKIPNEFYKKVNLSDIKKKSEEIKTEVLRNQVINEWLDKQLLAKVPTALWEQVVGLERAVHSGVDTIIPVLDSALTKRNFFSKGWGPVELYQYFVNETEKELQEPGQLMKRLLLPPTGERMQIQCEEKKNDQDKYRTIAGTYTTPVLREPIAQKFLPEELKKGYFELHLPNKYQPINDNTYVTTKDGKTPVCILLSGLGDNTMWMRETLFTKTLVEYGIGTLILASPYFLSRQPKLQTSSSAFLYLTDLLVMASLLTVETNSLFDWLHETGEFGPFGISGTSLGGHMACVSASFSYRPLALTPLITPPIGGSPWVQGVLQQSVNYEMLEKDLVNYKKAGICPENATAQEFMMEALTFSEFSKLPKPIVPSATIQVAAKYDQYIKDSPEILMNCWPGSSLRMLESGHITAHTKQDTFNKAIIDSFHLLLNEPNYEWIPFHKINFDHL